VEKYNEIMEFLEGRKYKVKPGSDFMAETVNMLWIEMVETGEPITEKMYSRITQRYSRFYTSKGVSCSPSDIYDDNHCGVPAVRLNTMRELSTEDRYNAPNAHLISHEPHSEDELINIIDQKRKLLKAKKIGEWVKKQSGNEII